MAEPREIPGFYYDADKKKYFRILPNHLAPEGSKYSKDNVKKENAQSLKRKRTAAFQQQKEAQTVQRSAILSSPTVAGIALHREQGTSRANLLESRTRAFAREAKNDIYMAMKKCGNCGKNDKIFDFVRDSVSGDVVWAFGSQNVARLEYVINQEISQDLAAFRSEITSLCLTNNRMLMATALGRAGDGNLYVARLTDDTFNADLENLVLDVPAPTYRHIGGPETSLWSCSASPRGGQDCVIIGGSQHSHLINFQGDFLQSFPIGEEDDVRSVDWLSHSVAVGGTRVAGTVMLWDSRTAGSTLRFQHPSGVTAVRGLDNDSQVLVAGFKGLAIYDVRMPAKAKEKKNGHRKPSRAVLRIPYKTQYPSTAMDVLPQEGYAAVADDENVVKLYSLSNGKELGTLSAPQKAGSDRISRLRLLARNFGVDSVMISQGPVLSSWEWGGAEGYVEGYDGSAEDEA